VGVGCIDITPTGSVDITGVDGNTFTTVSIPLYAKAAVFALGDEKAAVITLDLGKYPTALAEEAMRAIGEQTGIPADRVMIVASHTHSGPFVDSYEGSLTQIMVEAVKLAEKDLEACQLAVASIDVENVAHNRRLLMKGEVWNDWMVPMSTEQARYLYPAEGPTDPQLQVLAAIKKDGTYKTFLWNYACHANFNNTDTISADYPGRVQEYLGEMLGYEIPALYLPGACGDINPNNAIESTAIALGDGILESLKNPTMLETQSISFKTTVLDIPTRENRAFAEEELKEKWPAQYEFFKKNHGNAIATIGETSKTYICTLQLGNEFVIVTNPAELFCQYGLDIKQNSPYAFTMVAELTNGYGGYVPTLTSFDNKGYETWFAEGSFMSENAGEMIRDESIRMLNAGEEE